MAHTFNDQIKSYGQTGRTQWRAFRAETGSAKTQGLAVYCSLLPDFDHPGVLVVTRLKVQADEIAATINGLAGNNETAIAYHTGNPSDLGELSTYPVLVITHRAYEIGLDAVSKDHPGTRSWDHFHDYGMGQRKLVVIDEALDIVQEAQINHDKLNRTLGEIPLATRSKFPEQIAALEELLSLLRTMENAKDNGTKTTERILWSGKEPLPKCYDMTPLRTALRSVRFDHVALQRDDADENRRLTNIHDTVLREAQAVMETWNWYAKNLGNPTINTARLIVPEDITGAVILDATTSSNLIYKLFEGCKIIESPPTRSYTNVTLHVSKGHSVGKKKMVADAKIISPKLYANLVETLDTDRSVLVVTHLGVKHHLKMYGGPSDDFRDFQVGHWGAIDGRNDWQDFDTCVIFGLPYRPMTWAPNTYFALQGVQSDEWFSNPSYREFKDYPDIRHALSVGQLVTSVVQAINRIKCRRVTDDQGNCDPADVFILLPSDRTGDEVLEGVRKEMPGVVVKDWHYADLRKKPRKRGFDQALVSFAQSMRQGYRSVSDIKQELGISKATWERLAADLKNKGNSLATQLAETGVTYHTKRVGRSQRGRLVKSESVSSA